MTLITILIDGLAYGMVLFVLASGLSVTLGLMNVVNLAHGAFAMAGGYVTVVLMQRYGVPFLWTLPAAVLAAGAAGLALERTLYRPIYAKSHLDQVMFSIGLVFMAVAATKYFMGSQQQIIRLPEWLLGRFEVLGVTIGRYRLFVIVLCGALAVALHAIFQRTRFGSRLRAAVDDQRVARGLGIPVNALFAATFAAGSGLAGLGGALGIELLGLDPTFPLKFLIFMLIVVTVGGTTTISGPFFAAMLLGVADVMGKYFLPQAGAFIIYALMVVLLLWRPDGLFARSRT